MTDLDTTTGSPWTDEDVERGYEATLDLDTSADGLDRVACVLATIGPIIERERRAAKVEALREFARHAFKFKDGFYAAYWSAEAEIVAKEIEQGERD